MIDFPASPTVGQIFKTGNYTYKFDGSSWLSNPPNSAIPDAPNDGLVYGRQSKAWVEVSTHLKDGTVAAPALAFASEPGLGWYRGGTNEIDIAVSGARIVSFVALNPSVSSIYVNPRTAAGQGSISLFNQPSDAANYNQASINCTAAGYLQLVTGAGGTATQQPIQFNALSYEFVGNGAVTLFGGQVRFPATQKPTNDPNTLDDYREGVINNITNAPGVVITVNSGAWVKVGRIVTVQVTCTFAVTSNSNSVVLSLWSGLPAGVGALAIGYPGAAVPSGMYANLSDGILNVYASNGFATFAQMSGATFFFGGSYVATN